MVTKVPQILIENFQQAITDAVAAELNFDIADYSTTAEMNLVLTDYPTTLDMNSALAGKVDDAELTAAVASLSADINTAVNVAVPAAMELQKDFVASGAITAGQYVALRSDGNVEAVAGTETLASLGPDNTSLSVANSMRVMKAVYNTTSNKIALVYCNETGGGTNTVYAAIGTISGDTITFGTPVAVDTGASYYNAANMVWNAAGTTLVVVYKGANGYITFKAGTVSGTTITLGAAVQLGTTAYASPQFVFHDDTHGSRVIVFFGSSFSVAAATYSGTTMTVGAAVVLNLNNFSGGFNAAYDGANARIIAWGTGGGSTSLHVATVSGTTMTAGSEVTPSGAIVAASYDMTQGKLLLVTTASQGASSPASLKVVTISGTTPTVNAAVALGPQYFVQSALMPSVFDVTSGKHVFVTNVAQSTGTQALKNLVVYVATISGTTASISAPAFLSSGGVRPLYMFGRSTNSEIAIVYENDSDYKRWSVATGKLVSGAFLQTSNDLIKSTVPGIAFTADYTQMINAGWQLVDFGNWSTSASVLTAFAFSLPTESTNADDWIGVARAAVADAETVRVALRGGLDKDRSGLTPKTRYFLKGDGSLITADNGRPAGIAVSATELLMEAA